MEKIFILIFIWHLIVFAEGSCDNFKNGVVLLIAPVIIVNYFRKKTYLKKKVDQSLVASTSPDRWSLRNFVVD